MGKLDFPVVGVGASAGGLKSLQQFFDNIEADSNLAFVVITHLAPDKTSAMDELLAAHTSMDVQQVREKTTIQPDHIYIIPPNRQLILQGDQLLLEEKQKDRQAVVDVFFRSMAKECEKLAIGVILSGTGSDGTLGLKAVKEHGGVTMVQDPKEAEYGGMPQTAINADLVDFILPVKELSQKIQEHKQILGEVQVPLQADELSDKEAAALQEIFRVLLSKREHDFKHYKRTSVLRRLQRRMFVTQNKSIRDYQHYLESNADEIDELFNDLLISVTDFFRDPEAFEVIEKKVIPKLFEQKEPEDPIRVWITGCATGEEVYSLAILLHEYAATLAYVPRIKIFGTDVSEEALRIARKGVYPESIATDVSNKRLNRYFNKENSGYRICKEIRDNVLISHHDILADPPFLNQDLISCRNLLIYFNKDMQNEVLSIIHYSLQPEGFLFLGMADSTIGAKQLFAPVEKDKGIFKARQVPESEKDIPKFPLIPTTHRSGTLGPDKMKGAGDFTFGKTHYSLLAQQYAPASIIIDDNNRIMHSSKGVGKYLHYSEGEPTRDLLKIVSSEIQRGLRALIFQFNQLEEPQTVSKEVEIRNGDEETVRLQLVLRPIQEAGFPKGYRQITFEEIEETEGEPLPKKSTTNRDDETADIVDQLETELVQTKERLQQTIEQYETSNEELMASNEELQSMNEELQTTTEELETSKEELQSVNEELRTVNQELENKINELQQVNDDLKNLMEATEIGIIFVNKELNIQLYTENAKKLFHLIDKDKGRSLEDVNHKLQYDNIISDIQGMLEDFTPLERQVTTNDGDWYIMQIKPYKTTEQSVDGAVITFVDITELKQAEEELAYRAENEESLSELGHYLLEAKKIPSVAEQTISVLTDRLGLEYSVIWEIDEEKNQLTPKAATGWSKNNDLEQELGSNTGCDYALENKEPVVVDDFKNEDRFERGNWVAEQDFTSGIYVVVEGSKERYGLLVVYSVEPRSFTPHEVNFVQNSANMLGEAIERIRTENELQIAYDELEEKIKVEKELQREILDVEKEERWRLGQYLHDGTAQNLLGIKMLLDLIAPKIQQLDEDTRNEIEKIQRLIVKSEKNIRELSHFVLPIEVDEDITKAFQKLLSQSEELYGIDCDLSFADDTENLIEDPTSASSLYYITQEAIRNAVNHGNAEVVNIEVTTDSKFLNLTVKDDGVGYNKAQKGSGQGINIMKHRAELLGGSLEIKALPDTEGTLLKCKIPMERVRKSSS